MKIKLPAIQTLGAHALDSGNHIRFLCRVRLCHRLQHTPAKAAGIEEKYHVDLTGTDSYVEYPLPEDGDEVMGDGVEDIRVTPLSRRQLRQYR